MRTRTQILVAIAAIALVVVGMAATTQVLCPIEGGSAYFTGETRNDVSGKLLWKYICNTYGHIFWVVR